MSNGTAPAAGTKSTPLGKKIWACAITFGHNGKVFRIAHSQPLKEFIKYGSVFFIVLSYFCGVYHFHYH